VPRLSVVLSTLGMHDVLKRVLDGYSAQDVAPGTFEVVVASDRAEPDPAAVDAAVGDRPFEVRRVTAPVPGLSANRNAGRRAARAPLVLFTDNDTIPVPGLVREHLAWHARHPEAEAGVVGHVRWAPEIEADTFMRWLEHGVQFDFRNIRGNEAGWGRFYGANGSVKRTFADRVGDFDEERLPYGYEDLDWSYRASKLGFRVLYARNAVVDHLRTMSLEFWKKRVRRIALAERQFVELHPELPPYYFQRFSDALARPRSSGRGVRLAPYVPPSVPVLGPRVWTSVDLFFCQQLAPHFLDAWNEWESSSFTRAPDLSERADLADGA
jgi:GT2 family glycosyltransferase